MQNTRNGYTIDTDRARLDRAYIHQWLSKTSYWAAGRSRDVVERSIDGSLNFGLYQTESGAQVGFARVVTDGATFAWLCDVFVDEAHQGHGLGKWLLEVVTAHPDLTNIRRMMLATADAHGLYAQYGFEPLADPARWMMRQRG